MNLDIDSCTQEYLRQQNWGTALPAAASLGPEDRIYTMK